MAALGSTILTVITAFCALAGPAHALPRRVPNLRSVAPAAVARQEGAPCAGLFDSDNGNVFEASRVAACLATVPFNCTGATQLLTYYRDLLAFQSTTAFLKAPPPSYQQPAVDLVAGLDAIQEGINAGAFASDYDFETALLQLIRSAHDGHLDLEVGVSSIFGYGSSFEISSISIDGIQPPRPYLTADVYQAQPQPGRPTGPPPSPIVTINGIEAVAWLTQFAANNSRGLLEPHADWNALMQNPAADIQGIPPIFNGGTVFNPGDVLNIVLEDGTTRDTTWKALVLAPPNMPPLTTGQDLYTYLVLNQFPPEFSLPAAATTAAAAASTSVVDGDVVGLAATSAMGGAAASSTSVTAFATPSNWLQAAGVTAYPGTAIAAQLNLGQGGAVTGYFLDDPAVAVLSIPTFEMSGLDIGTFSDAIADFIFTSKQSNRTKIIVDLQQNYGGTMLLAVEAFKQFFPTIDPFTGSRMRASSYANTLGLTFTQFWQNHPHPKPSDTEVLKILPWAILDYENVDTGRAFASWPEYFSQHAQQDDLFSAVQRDNLSDTLFDQVASGGADPLTGQPLGITIYGYGDRSNVNPQPFPAEDIILLTDGICASACAVLPK